MQDFLVNKGTISCISIVQAHWGKYGGFWEHFIFGKTTFLNYKDELHFQYSYFSIQIYLHNIVSDSCYNSWIKMLTGAGFGRSSYLY